MTIPEYDSMVEMIADCADISPAFRPSGPVVSEVPLPRSVESWLVDDICLAQVQGLDEYG